MTCTPGRLTFCGAPPPPPATHPTRRNPFFKNERKTVEPHLLSTFPADFYGQELRLLVTGWLRPEASFPSLDALITAIRADIAAADAALGAPPHADGARDPFLAPAP